VERLLIDYGEACMATEKKLSPADTDPDPRTTKL